MADAVETPTEQTEAPDTQTVTVPSVKMKFRELPEKPDEPEPPVEAGDETVETEPVNVDEATEDAVETNIEETPASPVTPPAAPTRLTKFRKADNTLDEDRLEALEKIAEQHAAEVAYRLELEKKDPEVRRAILRAHKNAGGKLSPEDEAFLVPPKQALNREQLLQEYNRIEMTEGSAKALLWWHENVTVPGQEAVVRNLTKAEREADAQKRAEEAAVQERQNAISSVAKEMAVAAKKYPKLFKENKENDFGFDIVNPKLEAELMRLEMSAKISVTERVEIALGQLAKRNPPKKAAPQAPLRSTPGNLQRPSSGGVVQKYRIIQS